LLLSDVIPDMVKVYKDTIFCCDDCNSSFRTSEIIVKSANNIQFSGLLNIKSHKHNNSTWYLHCPKCETVHLFGFDIIKK
jgi:hypothetical protein